MNSIFCSFILYHISRAVTHNIFFHRDSQYMFFADFAVFDTYFFEQRKLDTLSNNFFILLPSIYATRYMIFFTQYRPGNSIPFCLKWLSITNPNVYTYLEANLMANNFNFDLTFCILNRIVRDCF